jgi:hypothetical protein
MIRSGTISLAVGLLLVLAPLVLGRGTLNKYVVVVGFLCACAGLSLLLNGLIDRIARRR